MSINKKLLIVLAVGSIVGVSSCKKFENVNQNPNVAHSATVQTLLPAAELQMSSQVAVDLEIDGSIWGQYWSQNPGASQYHSLDQYSPGQDGFSYPWIGLYAANENFRQLYILADSGKQKQYMAISLLMQAYTFQLITDGWGDVPFTQALKGQYGDGHVVNPAYDAQKVVYQGIINLIDTANTLINTSDPTAPGADDLIYAGNMGEWQKFSNTLMLRVLMRMSKVDPGTAGPAIIALYASSGGNFIGEGDDALINYGSSSANKNPLYAEAVGLGSVQNLVGSSTCIDSLNSNDDYRAYVFYEASNNGLVEGIPQGQYGTTPPAGTVSIPSNYVGGDAQNTATALNSSATSSANAPVKFITSYESFFLQAEAQVRFVGGDGSTEFYEGIHASFYAYSAAFSNLNLQLTAASDSGTSYNGNLVGDVFLTTDYAYYSYLHGDTLFTDPSDPLVGSSAGQYPASGTTEQRINYIITQKWYSMCGNEGFEAWTEWRRTGYPSFFTISQSSIIGNQFPKRFLYPTSESTTNSSYPSTGLAPLTSNVWWDL